MPKIRSIFDLIDGLSPVDPEALKAYEQAMERAFPEIIAGESAQESEVDAPFIVKESPP